MGTRVGEAALLLKGIEKRFGLVTAVRGLDLAVAQGEFVTLLGPSGCGKSTTLGLIAGFFPPDAGEIYLGGRHVENLPPFARDIGVVFQDYALFPHMTVAQNVAFGLKMRRVDRAEINARVEEALDLVKLGGLGSRRPLQLSGGQRQRVALARALVVRPTVLLLDEPLSNLDLKLREEMRAEIAALQRRLAITTVFVTHDQGEALAMSDRIAVMNAGAIEQIGRPTEIYERPATRFVADFIGRTNVMPATVGAAGSTQVSLVTVQGATIEVATAHSLATGARALLAVRPERATLATAPVADALSLRAEVTQILYLGASREIHLTLDDGPAVIVDLANDGREPPIEIGDRVWFVAAPASCLVLPA
ncbi:MAG: ABC transporter ATP-binding protein [Alphaproteobacteria bacterium]|nr:ABC transporter ATP-binding protein [Alphaproteobacteria bacterium]